jgi:triosephosphate isomerase
MYKTLSEATEFLLNFPQKVAEIGPDRAEIVICPPFISLADFSRLMTDTGLVLGAQNMHWEKEGAYTGEISPLMLGSLGVKYVIIGHSERRSYFGEDDRIVLKKVEAAFAHNLSPILCIGENEEQFKSGKTDQVLKEQLFSALQGLFPQQGIQDMQTLALRLVVAYEPVWAIGTGNPATGGTASRVAGYIRSLLRELWGEVAEEIRILYGGSVNPGNILEFAAESHIDGALIGGSSLQENNLAEMARIVAGERRG